VSTDAIAVKAKLEDVQPLRALFLQEANFQVRYNACHERGWSDSYLLEIDGATAGYGSIKGQKREERDTVFEFYVMPPFRKHASTLFQRLLTTSAASYIECQTNDRLLCSMLYEFGHHINADTVLFEDHAVTAHQLANAVVRLRRESDRIFPHAIEPVGEYVLEIAGEIAATGGFMLHYNLPFADLYMEVREDRQRKGLGSFILQEVKKACYQAGRVPAARCPLNNHASRATLINAGLRVCGFMLLGKVKERPKDFEADPA